MEREGKRLNKYISDAGLASRREADRMIDQGKVEIRRRTRKGEPEAPVVKGIPGDRVFPGDTVYVNGRELPKKSAPTVVMAYHKPRGVVCTLKRDIPGNLADAVGYSSKLVYAGRLDKDSSGLLILTSDGMLADRITRAASHFEKEYLVTVGEPLTETFLRRMAGGVKIRLDDEETLRRHPDGLYVTTRPCRVKRTGERSFSIVLTQGFNRQIRRMCAALGFRVTSIRRIRIMDIRLGSLQEGELRRLTPQELEGIVEKCGERAHNVNAGRE